MLNIVFSIVYVLLITGTLLVLLFDDSDTGKKLSWMFIIIVLPGFGLILYLMIGMDFRHHWYFNKKHKKFLDCLEKGRTPELDNLLFGHKDEEKIVERFRPLSRMVSHESGMTVSDDNNVEIITEGKRKFYLLMQDLEKAKSYIHLEYFIFGDDNSSKEIKHMLMKKAKEGVQVRFIHENIANLTISNKYYNEMKKAGVQVVKFTNPRKHLLNFVTTLNYRDHRKIVVIDGEIGYTGGMNIGDEYFNIWRDTHLRIEGSAVADLQFSFLSSWLTAGGSLDGSFSDYFKCITPDKLKNGELVQIIPDEPNDTYPTIQMSMEWACHNAKKYLYFQTPYFVPPEPLLNAMKAAALSGIEIILMLPQKADATYMDAANKSFFSECIDAGIRIFERGGEFIHSKTLVCDDYLSVIGTANMDFRSFNLNYEINTYIFDTKKALLNKQIFLKDLELSKEITFAEWEQRRLFQRFKERFMRLFSPLL